MGKNLVSITKASISFIIWNILFEIIFFMIIGCISNILMMTIDNEVTTNIVMIIPKVIAQFLVINFLFGILKKNKQLKNQMRISYLYIFA